MGNTDDAGQAGNKPAEIWAVGGGKGGTGKTFAISQLAIHLASRGKKVILADTDFGGANIHSFFGIRKPAKCINDFMEKRNSLPEIVTPTGVPGLGVIVGDYHSISSGNMNYAQKTKLFRHLQQLEADYVLLDLGGGTSNDTIDAFLLADRMIVVAMPEITSIENLFQFIKNAFFRKLKFVFSQYGLKKNIREIWINRRKLGINTIVDLLAYVRRTTPHVNAILEKELNHFSLNIVLNMVRNAMEIREGFSIRSICIKYIGISTLYSGYIEYDFQFWKNLSLIQTAPRLDVSSRVKKDITRIAENIITGDQMNIGSLKNV